ncbi:hypothetical protein HCN44_005345 [Aphidius gifuensis]|uniref:Uncharacterized protein n=1 Tax=Aphidius gifuensis TaxID=684658 RepID=A0A835CX36_APHGI|nr:uncharacterized protein LOC122856080 [Aphidius gifuensis]KAF7997068.1 hypothetical protein HCN44_005345 [Aphidius gifuensis]
MGGIYEAFDDLIFSTFENDLMNYILGYRSQSHALLDCVASIVKLQMRNKQIDEAYKELSLARKEFLKLQHAYKYGKVRKFFPRVKTYWKVGKAIRVSKVSNVSRWKKRGDPLKFDCENNFIVLDNNLLEQCRILVAVSSICWDLADELEILACKYFSREFQHYSVPRRFENFLKAVRQKQSMMIKLRAQLDGTEKVDEDVEQSAS